MRSNDLALALACIAGLVAVVVALTRVDATVERREESALARAPAFGELEEVQAAVRRRPARALGWETLGGGEIVHERDTLFVPPGGSAVLRTSDGSRLMLEENTLIVLESSSDERPSIEVSRGTVTGVAANRGLAVTREGRRTELGEQAAVRVEDARVAVLSGEALVATSAGTRKLASAESAQLGERGAISVTTFAVMPVAPATGERIYVSSAEAEVTLEWLAREGAAGPARVQISASPDFRVLIAELKAERDAHVTWRTTSRGTRYWRLVSSAGEPLSPVDSFGVQTNTPPVPLSPRHLEQVTAPPPRIAVPFAWTRVDGSETYLLEIARDASFAKIEKQLQATRTQALVYGLPEATYYWRVRAEGSTRPPSPSSSPRAFKLTHKPLVGAPELFDAEVEVNGD